MKQTGLLIKEDPRDYRVGASPLVGSLINENGDWKNWRPSGERQYKEYAFDTLSCATFGALNVVETTINYLLANNKISDDHLQFLIDNGYIEERK